ncbi:c-type heme family protein [Kaarinaea lacus]
MNQAHKFSIYCLLLAIVLVYLLVSAPPPLAENAQGKTMPTRLALELLQQENARVRELYTKEIVGEGKKRKIKFSEDWKQDDVHAGLLPAQFLRETARYMERSKIQLGLFLGSDYAINQANQFEGEQKSMFQKMKLARDPVFFFYPDAQRYTYMFPDVAVVDACVDCHNDHKDSPKSDWQLNDVMGATTWTFPQERITVDAFLQTLTVLRQGFRAAYEQFLGEIKRMPVPPGIGDHWPREGYYIPSTDVFMSEVRHRSSVQTLNGLMLSMSELHKDKQP